MNKEIRTGIIAIFTIVVLIYGINYLKGLNILDKNRIFHAKYDNIDGLLKGSVISLNGFNVGIVSNISLQSDNSLLVSVKINEDFDVPANSTLKISNQDLMGTKGISVILGNSDLLAKNNDTLIAEIENSLQDEVNKQILPLKNKAEGLISSVDSLMVIFTSVLNTDARKNLASSFKNLDETFILMSESMKELNKLVVTNEKNISNSIKNFESITGNISDNNESIENILKKMSSISDSVSSKDIGDIIKNLNNITNKISVGQGNLGLLNSDDQLYRNIEKTTNDISILVEEIKKDPKKYFNFSVLGNRN
ncbi:MlaD family protein [Bacteroidota bacterium]|nr:MlaD family protein [Bacteroidota bacterium]